MLKKGMQKACQGIKKLKSVNLAFFVLCLMFMLFSANYANSQNLSRSELNAQIKASEDHARRLNVSVSELQSTQRIENESKRLDLVKVQSKDTYYLSAKDERVALK